MDKLILKKIAKDWAKGILFSTEADSFDEDSLLSVEEQYYVVEEVQKIAMRLTNGNVEVNLDEIISKYYET